MAGPIRGSRAIRQHEENLRCAFPGATVTVSATVGSGGMTAVQWEFCGVHTGPIAFAGQIVAATNRPLRLRGASFLRFTARGLIAEEHRYYDIWSVLEQLGVA
jgi:hypothetical protein